MKVYRIEHTNTGQGPFTRYTEGLPMSWLDSHFPPMESCSPVYDEYIAWIDFVDPKVYKLPICYYFAFTTLEQLKRCFIGYEKFTQLSLMEYTIATEYKEDYCVLSDGQVIFSKVIESRIL